MAEKIKIIFLGTSQAVPTAKRNHTAVLLKYKNENLLFDCGEGTQRQFRKARLNPCKITRIFITHWHGDHILGIPGLLQTFALSGYNKTLFVYGPKGTRKFMTLMTKLFIRVGKIKIKVSEVGGGKILDCGDFEIRAEQMRHGAPCLAYAFVEKDKIRINKKKLKKFRIKKDKRLATLKKGKDIIIDGKKLRARELTYTEKGRKVCIIMDTQMNKNIIKIAKNSDLMVCEATYTENERELANEYKHLTAKQAAEAAKKAGVKKLILTHLSQRYQKDIKDILGEAKKVFKNSVVAEDLMEIGV